MTDADHDAFLNTVVYDYAWNFRVMLSDIEDFLKLSEDSICSQFRTTQQSIRRRCQLAHFDDDNLPQSFEESELQNAKHRFTVALPMQIRYAALGALTNTIEWAAHFFQQSWKSPLPKKPINLQNSQTSALTLLKHFDVVLSLNKTDILRAYGYIVDVRNAVVHSGGIINKYNKPKLKKAVDKLDGFAIANWHFLGECVQIDRGALDPHINGMAQLLFEIYKTADEKEMLEFEKRPNDATTTSSG